MLATGHNATDNNELLAMLTLIVVAEEWPRPALWTDRTMKHKSVEQTDTQLGCRQATAAAAAAVGRRVKNNHPTTQVLDQSSAASMRPVERAIVGHLMTIRQSL